MRIYVALIPRIEDVRCQRQLLFFSHHVCVVFGGASYMRSNEMHLVEWSVIFVVN